MCPEKRSKPLPVGEHEAVAENQLVLQR